MDNLIFIPDDDDYDALLEHITDITLVQINDHAESFLPPNVIAPPDITSANPDISHWDPIASISALLWPKHWTQTDLFFLYLALFFLLTSILFFTFGYLLWAYNQKDVNLIIKQVHESQAYYTALQAQPPPQQQQTATTAHSSNHARAPSQLVSQSEQQQYHHQQQQHHHNKTNNAVFNNDNNTNTHNKTSINTLKQQGESDSTIQHRGNTTTTTATTTKPQDIQPSSHVPNNNNQTAVVKTWAYSWGVYFTPTWYPRYQHVSPCR